MMNAKQENARMLASILGINEDDACNQLDRVVLITAAETDLGQAWAREIAEQAGQTIIVKTEIDDAVPDLELVIGNVEPRTPVRRLHAAINCTGVYIGGSHQLVPADGRPHGLEVMIAASLATAAVVARVIDSPALPRVPDPLKFNFIDLGINKAALSAEIDLTGSVLIGAGGVANGFMKALRYIDVRGTLPIVDPKLVGRGNLNRCYYFLDKDIGRPKAVVLAERAKADFSNLTLIPVPDDYKGYLKSAGPSRRVVVTVDSRRVRRAIEKELPLDVIDASTTDIREVIVHSHRKPTIGACLGCIYHHVPDENARERSIADGLGITIEDVQRGFVSEEIAERMILNFPSLQANALVGMAFDSLFKQLCAEQALLTPEGRQTLAPFAFVSNLAGALQVIELLRMEHRESDASNYWMIDPWRGPNARLRRWRDRHPDCEICNDGISEAVIRDIWHLAEVHRKEG
jgi:molybdopterin/thiamine biosynthesis adenylyltransferase